MKEMNDDNDIIIVDAEYEKYDIESITASKTNLAKITNVSKQELKTMVKLFYETQNLRIITAANTKSAKSNGSEDEIVNAFYLDALDYKKVETNISNQLKAICQSQEVGRWLMQITGIGPVLAAGLLAYFDVTKSNYATGFLQYAGLNDQNRPWLGKEKSKKILNDILDGRKDITDQDVYEYSAQTQWKYNYFLEKAYNERTGHWSRSELEKAASKIPYNRDLKVLLWKVGQSFQYQKNRPSSLYGKIINERQVYEMEKNENKEYADQAAQILETKNIGKDTEAYKYYSEGKLPPAHINARVLRYAEKILVCHLFEEMYRVEYNKIPPRYYALEHIEGHNKEIYPEVPYTLVEGEPGYIKESDDMVVSKPKRRGRPPKNQK